MINSVGDLLEPIFIIADDTMVPGKFHPYRVKNLGVGTGPGCSAWLVFCNTRCWLIIIQRLLIQQSPSTTEAGQLCDRGNLLFKGSKTKLNYIKDRYINKESCRVLIKTLNNVIEQHKT